MFNCSGTFEIYKWYHLLVLSLGHRLSTFILSRSQQKYPKNELNTYEGLGADLDELSPKRNVKKPQSKTWSRIKLRRLG